MLYLQYGSYPSGYVVAEVRVVNRKQNNLPCLTYENTNHEERSETTDNVSQCCHKHEEVGHVFSEMLEKGIEESNKASLIITLGLCI